ncbi:MULTISPECIES: hypothetical protein [Caballeronia]|uniref:hypothetical protein n=1 Tax=Caballeronia TaxID=1827195 RepID=UPI0007897471|nr:MULTISPECIES: hypothetical protein [Caballeronia]
MNSPQNSHVAADAAHRLTRLVEQFGGDYALPDIGAELANCPSRNAAAHGERCDVHFPGLPAILDGTD